MASVTPESRFGSAVAEWHKATEQSPVASMRRFVRSRRESGSTRVASERCELCSAALPCTHRHLLEMTKRRVVCACDPCAMRFHDVVGGRFKLIPRDARILPRFNLSDAQWENLSLPINLAFFFFSSPLARMTAIYPGPAGATESLLPLTAWTTLVADNPMLEQLEPDIEALLVNRVASSREYFIAPIDACYELVGLIRLHWRGLSGGDAVWREIACFFSRLQENAKVLEVQDA
jgi:Family of unknown function (DUF5947)